LDAGSYNLGYTAYGTAGGYGNLSLPFQLFVTAYRQLSGGIPRASRRRHGLDEHFKLKDCSTADLTPSRSRHRTVERVSAAAWVFSLPSRRLFFQMEIQRW
jgi:hypothetical protein